MSYHIVNIDAPDCSNFCKDGQLTFKSAAGLAAVEENAR